LPALRRRAQIRHEEVIMRHANQQGPASPWKHKVKVLLAFAALCLVTAFSGIGFAAETVGQQVQIFR
jgi:hypothetical protein